MKAQRQLATLMALTLAGGGCQPSTTRSFAVTVTDALTLDCRGVSKNAAIEQEALDSIAKDTSKSWEKEAKKSPPRPHGRVLLINELEHQMQAWFEPRPEADTDAPFAGPLAVYRGELHEGYLEGSYDDLFSSDEEDEDAGREPCGPRPLAGGVLSLTDDDGVLGRVRWTEYQYVSSVTSACAGWIACARDVRVEGLEME